MAVSWSVLITPGGPFGQPPVRIVDEDKMVIAECGDPSLYESGFSREYVDAIAAVPDLMV